MKSAFSRLLPWPSSTSASNIALKLQELITYLVDHYSHRFAEIDYVETFKLLHIKYEQQQVRSVGVVG